MEKKLEEVINRLDALKQEMAALEQMVEELTAAQKASLAEHQAVLDDVKRRVHQMTAGVPLNKY